MIKLENISKKYSDNIILKDINIHVKKCDIFALVGYSGAGKSTILKIMSGFLNADSGSVYIENQLLTNNNKHLIVRETSMIFQNYNLLNNLNVLDNILLPIKIRKKVSAKDELRVNELLEFVGLTDKKDSYISKLSGGEKQRVAIARALITNPKIIFLDEPTSALDKKNTNIILKLIKEINIKYDTTIVIVSHDISVVKSIANKVVIIDEGLITDQFKINPTEIIEFNYREEFK